MKLLIIMENMLKVVTTLVMCSVVINGCDLMIPKLVSLMQKQLRAGKQTDKHTCYFMSNKNKDKMNLWIYVNSIDVCDITNAAW